MLQLLSVFNKGVALFFLQSYSFDKNAQKEANLELTPFFEHLSFYTQIRPSLRACFHLDISLNAALFV